MVWTLERSQKFVWGYGRHFLAQLQQENQQKENKKPKKKKTGLTEKRRKVSDPGGTILEGSSIKNGQSMKRGDGELYLPLNQSDQMGGIFSIIISPKQKLGGVHEGSTEETWRTSLIGTNNTRNY